MKLGISELCVAAKEAEARIKEAKEACQYSFYNPHERVFAYADADYKNDCKAIDESELLKCFETLSTKIQVN